jgi:hypothetical protein
MAGQAPIGKYRIGTEGKAMQARQVTTWRGGDSIGSAGGAR